MPTQEIPKKRRGRPRNPIPEAATSTVHALERGLLVLQALAREGIRRSVLGIDPVQRPRGLGLRAEVGEVGHRGLHAERELVVGEGSLDRRVGRAGAPVQAVEQAPPRCLAIGPGVLPARVRDGLAVGAERRTLVGRADEAAAVALDPARGVSPPSSTT